MVPVDVNVRNTNMTCSMPIQTFPSKYPRFSVFQRGLLLASDMHWIFRSIYAHQEKYIYKEADSTSQELHSAAYLSKHIPPNLHPSF